MALKFLDSNTSLTTSPISVSTYFDARSEFASRQPTSHKDRIAASLHAVTDLVATINKIADEMDAPELRVTYDRNFARSFTSQYADDYTQALLRGEPEKGRGYLGYESTVREVLRALKHLLSNDPSKPNVALHAPMQSGKSGFIVLLTLLLRMKHMQNDDAAMVAMMPYASRAPMVEMQQDILASTNIYAALSFEGSDYTLQSANAEVATPKNGSFVARNRKQNLDNLIGVAKTNGMDEIVVVMDEADHASSKAGVLAKMMKFGHNPDNNLKLRYVLVSATPYEFGDVSSCLLIEVKKSASTGYRGINQGIPLNIGSFVTLGKLMGLKEINDKFDVARVGERPQNAKAVAKMLVNLIEGVDAPHLGLNGKPLNGGSAMMVRYGTQAKTQAVIKEFYKLTKGRHNVVENFNNNVAKMWGETLTIEQIMARANGLFTIIFMTGLGRRADRFPNECTVFLDFTRKYTTGESFFQGTIGRACGYKGDNTVVFVSEPNMKAVEDTRAYYKATGRDVAQLKSMRGIRVGGGKIRRLSTKTRLPLTIKDIKAMDPTFGAQLEARFNRHVGERLNIVTIPRDKVYMGDVKPGFNSNYVRTALTQNQTAQYRFNYVKLLGGESGVKKIEAMLSRKLHNSVSILRPGQTRMFRDDPAGFNDVEGYIQISVGNFFRSGHTGGADVATRREVTGPATRGVTNTTPGNKALVPEVLFEIIRDAQGNYIGQEVRSITFWFEKDVEDHAEMHESSGDAILPGMKSCYFQYLASDADRDAVREQMAEDHKVSADHLDYI